MDDDLPPKPAPSEETAAGDFGQLFGAGMWLAVFLALAGVVLYFVIHAHS